MSGLLNDLALVQFGLGNVPNFYYHMYFYSLTGRSFGSPALLMLQIEFVSAHTLI